jgi:hypothetical protein
MDFAGRTTSALDGVLVPEGFAAGQGGDTQVIYCASHDELSDRFPRFPQANAQPRGLGCCIDLVVRSRETGFEVDFESVSLSDTLRVLDLEEAAGSVDQFAQEPLTTALATLVEVLPQLFRASAT